MPNPALETATSPASTTVLKPAASKRLLSIDVVRGITIAFMIMVNNNGGTGSWGFMNHAAYNGLTPTDLVFPTFVFVIGMSIVFGYEARLRKGATRAQLAWHTVQRAVILFALGMFVNTFPFYNIPYVRFYGVLQRSAICYLIVALFYLYDRRVWTKVAALVFCLVGYWVLLRWVPVPGAGMPGRDIPFMDMRLNLTSWIDRALMPHHLYLDWSGPDAHNVRDPEGLLSDLPTCGTALLGLLAGLWLRSQRAIKTTALGLAAAAVTCLALGYLWSFEFPFNKNMWTSSFVLEAAGWSLTVLTLAYWVTEQWGWGKNRSAALAYPFLVLGANSIAVYIFSEIAPGLLDHIPIPGNARHLSLLNWLDSPIFTYIHNPGWATFAFSVFTLAYCFIPAWILYRKKIFIKV